MASATDAVWISVLPSMKNFASIIQKDGSREAEKGGKDLGRKLGAGMLAGMAVIVGGAALAGKALYNIGETFDDMTDTIRVGTGATGKNLQALTDAAKNVGKSVPASFGDIGTTIADVNTRLGLTGKPLEDISAQFLELSRITGTDVASNIENVSRVFGDWGVSAEQQGEKLDYLFKVSQSTGIGIDDLSQKVVQYGAPMRQFGFSFEESAALMGKWAKEGVNTETVMGGLRMGLGKISKAGKDPAQAFKDITAQIKNAGSAGEANAIAIEAFGQRAGPDMAAAVREGRLDLDELVASLEGSSETIMTAGADTMDFAEAWLMFKNQVLVVVEPLATALFAAIGTGMQWINTNAVPAVAAFVAGWRNFEGVGGRVREGIDGILGGLRAASGVIAVVGGLIAAVFIPHWIALGVQATISGAKQAAAWVAAQAGAARAAAVHSLTVVKMVAGWVLMGTQALVHGAVIAGQWVLMGIRAGIAAGQVVASNVIAAGSFIAHQLAILATAAAMGIVRGAVIAWTAVQWLLNVALNANPIGLVVIGLTLLVAAIVLAWRNSETFRNIVIAVWTAIRDVALAVVNWFVNTALPILRGLWDAIAAGFSALRDNVNRLITAMVDFVVGRFNWWRDTLTTIATAIRDFVMDRVTRLRDLAIAAVTVLVNTTVGTFTRWRDNVVALATNVRDWIMERLEALRSGAVSLFERMVSGIGAAWDRLKAVTAAPVRFVIETVINGGIIRGWNGLVGLLKLPDSLRINPLPVPAFARGGILPGPGTSAGDDMMVVDRYGRPRATVASGEPVISREQYARNRDTVDSILAGRELHGPLPNRIPGFFNGGILPVGPGSISRHSGYSFARWAGDMARPMGTPVKAWNDGIVAYTRRLATSYGHHIMLNHGALGSSLYAHLSRIAVSAGQRVAQGQVIGNVGSTGNSSGPHLHFEIRGGNAALGGDTGSAGGGFFDMIGSWITDRLAAPVRALIDRIPGSGVFVDAAKGMGTNLLNAAIDKIKSLIPGDSVGAAPGGGVERWRPLVQQALGIVGQPLAYTDTTLRRMNQESSGNPRAINNWDSNAKRGTPSKGLMQVIDPTFRAYAHPAYNRDIWDPMSNVLASMRYAVARYGSLPAAYNRKGGYDSGGWLPPGVTMAHNDTGKPEAVLTNEQWQAIKAGRSGLTIRQDITVNNPVNEPTSDSAMAMSGMIGQLVGR